jgi:hypothetical protein
VQVPKNYSLRRERATLVHRAVVYRNLTAHRLFASLSHLPRCIYGRLCLQSQSNNLPSPTLIVTELLVKEIPPPIDPDLSRSLLSQRSDDYKCPPRLTSLEPVSMVSHTTLQLVLFLAVFSHGASLDDHLSCDIYPF